MQNTSAACAISVVIPVYNRQQLGERAVLSACAQEVDGIEIVLVDDGSQPPFQLPIIDKRVNVRLIRLAQNSGSSAARNAGIVAARGEWIALLDSDDYWLPSTLGPRLDVARKLAASANGGMLACAAGFIIKKQADDLGDVRIPREAKTPSEFVCGCWFAPGSTMLVRKEVFERVGPWDTELARLEDYDWFLRFAVAGGSLKVWEGVAAVTEVEGKPTAPVLEAAVHRVLEKYARRNSPRTLPARMIRRMKAYIDVERASMRWYCGEPAKTLFYLARSFLRVPRSTIHLGRFWNAVPSAPLTAMRTVGPDAWLRSAISLNQGSCFPSNGSLEIVTDPRSGGYSALLPLERPTDAAGPVRFRCGIEVIEGSMGVSVVTADCTILAERVAGRPGHHELDIVVPLARQPAGILVRNYAMTGRPSRGRVSSVSAEACPAEQLPHIRSNRHSRALHLPLRSYGSRQHPRETGELTTIHVAIETSATAALVIDAWQTLGDHVTQNIVQKLAPTMTALRAAGVNIVHLAHDQPVHVLANPLEGETVIPGEFMDTDYIADMFRSAGVKHLLYLGYFSNQCVLRRSLGMLEMQKRGFDTILVRDASAARESPESLGGEWFHRASVHFIEINDGRTTTAAEIQAAVADAMAGS